VGASPGQRSRLKSSLVKLGHKKICSFTDLDLGSHQREGKPLENKASAGKLAEAFVFLRSH
jgi:hypothetical protein